LSLPSGSGRDTIHLQDTLAKPVQINPNTTLAHLLAAIPSARGVCDRLQIQLAGNGDKSVEQLCREAGVPFASFLQALDEINWEEDYRPEIAGDGR
jgi:hypothetical protein